MVRLFGSHSADQDSIMDIQYVYTTYEHAMGASENYNILRVIVFFSV